jgi:uncharacterized membrane protein YfhO
MIKIRDYFWHQRMILLSFIIPGLILLGLFAKIGIFPFGSLTLLISDMNSQYVDFMANISGFCMETVLCYIPGMPGWD